jgi:lysophospholipase L1-like esterase
VNGSRDSRFPRRSITRLFLAAAAALLTGGLAGCGGSDDNDSAAAPSAYQAAWVASMMDATQVRAGTTPVVETFANQSVRQVVRLSLGGDRVRVKVSNLFGKAPVTFSGVQVARSTSGSGIDVASSRAVTFGGQPSVTLPAGSELLSDAVPFTAHPLDNVAVTMYFASPATLNTVHALSRQTTYIGAGDQLAAPAIAASAADQRQSYYGLATVEALGTEPRNVVVMFGDSITDGDRSTVDAAKRLPNQLDDRLKAAGFTNVGVVNSGIAGNRWILDVFGPNANSRFERDALQVAGVTHVIVFLGINDLRNSFRFPAQAVSTDQVIASMTAAVRRAKAQGLKVQVGTLMPCRGETFCPASVDADREVVNAWIRSQREADGVIDFDRVMRNPNAPAELNPAYDSGDRLHPNDLGYGVMAAAIDLAQLR